VHGPTGNEGVSVERWYRQAVVVLWPRSNYVQPLAREGPAFAVPRLAAMIEASDDPSAEPEHLRFASAILDHWACRMGGSHDPEARTVRLKLNKARRQHLHEQVTVHKLDMTHVTEREGSPYTLVCTKTRGSYVRAVQRYEDDVRSLAALGEGASS